MRKFAKSSAFALARVSGLDALIERSQWRASRVLILCYHGISLEREHEWDRELYMSPAAFHRRMELLKQHRCSVLPLAEALQRQAQGTLPPRSVVITFDDGMYDFYRQAAPILNEFGYTATVYLTSFYAAFNHPVFLLACSYLLWKYQVHQLKPLSFAPIAPAAKLATAQERATVRSAIENWVEREKPSASEQQAALSELSEQLGGDPCELSRQRILHLMNPHEVAEVASQGFRVELHTHRHRTPLDAALFRREIVENRDSIAQWTGHVPQHFCYPMGWVRPQFAPWLRDLGVSSGVTCVPGLASAQDDRLLLPRLIDHSGLSEIEFESWLSGSGAWLRTLKLRTLHSGR